LTSVYCLAIIVSTNKTCSNWQYASPTALLPGREVLWRRTDAAEAGVRRAGGGEHPAGRAAT
jgi:hypothetical protein